jgi:hypothetical protein
MNKYGHLHIQNDNTSPPSASTIDSPLWSVGQRDGGQLDIAFGSLATQLVSANDKLLELKRDANSATGAKQIGFLGATAVSQQSASFFDHTGAYTAPAPPPPPMPPSADPTFDAELDARFIAIEQSIGEIITALKNFGLLS